MIKRASPWVMPGLRTVLFLAFQAVIAVIFFSQGVLSSWNSSAGWWPITASVGSLVVIILLIWLYRREGLHYWTLFHFQRETLGCWPY